MFERPEWLVLLAILPVVIRFRRSLAPFLTGLRAALCALLYLALCGLQLPTGSGALDLWVLLDRSASFEGVLATNFAEWHSLLARAQPSSGRLRYIDFATGARERASDISVFEDDIQQTRIAAAVHYAVSRFTPGRSNRILIISDGFATESLGDLERLLRRAEAPLDIRLSSGPDAADVAIASLVAPSRVATGESFIFELTVRGAVDAKIPYTISVNGVRRASGFVEMTGGRGSVLLSDAIEATGSFRYQATIEPPYDPVPGNNSRETWIDVAGKGHVLVLTRYTNDPVAASLRGAGWSVVEVRDTSGLNAGSLSGVRAVVLNDIHASKLPRTFLDAIPFYITSQGGGLLMLGGKESFAAGGYYGSSVEPLLPVSMELRNELRRIPVQMALVLDRSGSMGTSVEGNMAGLTKMDLANEGAARTADLLAATDSLSVSAVDTNSHPIVDLAPIGTDRSSVQRRIRSITSGGGGIYVYEGLSEAWKALKTSEQARKHIVLFSDASDSEQPGEFRKLLSEIVASRGTVSVIGLGKTTDADAALLQEIARLGEGRAFFVDNAVDLPAVFAQETVSVARSLFVTEPTASVATPDWRALSKLDLEWPSALDGYNLSYLKPGASLALISKDEFSAPLVSFWHRGAGRVAAVAFPMAGESAGNIRGWSQYGEFLGTLTGWLAAPESPPGTSIKTRVLGTTAEMTLMFGSDIEASAHRSPPKLSITGMKGATFPLTWERLAPGRFTASYALSPGETIRGAAHLGRFTLPFGPIGSQSLVEWDFDPRTRQSLRDIAIASGGRELVNLSDAWVSPSTKHPYSFTTLLLSLALVLFLLDTLIQRTSINLRSRFPDFSWKAQQARQSSIPYSELDRDQPTNKGSLKAAPLERKPSLEKQLEKAKRRGKE